MWCYDQSCKYLVGKLRGVARTLPKREVNFRRVSASVFLYAENFARHSVNNIRKKKREVTQLT